MRERGIRGLLSAEQNLASLGCRDLDVLEYPIAMHGRGEGTHLGRHVLGVTQLDARGKFEELRHELIHNGFMNDQPAGRDARLALVVEDAERGAIDGRDEIGVLEHDVGALTAELEVHLL